jgi:hypothetical protein
VPPRRDHGRDLASGDALDRCDHAAHGSGASTAEIERERALPRLQRPQCCQVCPRKVADVDEIALAGAVRGGIVGAQERQRRALPAGCVDGERNEVGFRVVALHQLSLGIGSGGIEITQAGCGKPARCRNIGEDLLAGEFRSPVRADGILRRAFRDRKRRRNSIGRARAREHDCPRAEARHGIEHVDEAGNIDAVIGERLFHGLAHISERGEMNDGGRTMSRERRSQRGGIKDIALHQRTPAHEFGVSAREVIEGDRHEPLRGERLAGMAADEPGPAGDKDTLAHIRFLARRMCNKNGATLGRRPRHAAASIWIALSANVGGLEAAVGSVLGLGLMMEAAVGEGSAQPFMKEEKEQGDLNSFRGEAVGVAGSVTLQQGMAFELAQIVAQLVETIGAA